MKLSIVIIQYKSDELIQRCLKHIARMKFTGSYEIIIVDNDNSPKLLAKLQKQNKKIKILPYKGNLGFAGGNNRAFKVAKGTYVLALNADAFVTKEYIQKCVDFLDKNKEYGSIQGKLMLDGDKARIDSTGHILYGTGFATNENHRIKSSKTKTPSKEVFGVCAAAAIYRKKALDTVKLKNDYYDTDFFAYLEDIDLDWRLHLAGYKAYFLNDAICHHIREATTVSGFRFRQALKNRFYMILKNETTGRMLLNLLTYWPVLLFLPERVKNFKLIGKMLKKRKVIQRKAKVHPKEIHTFMKPTPLHRWLRIFKLITLARK